MTGLPVFATAGEPAITVAAPQRVFVPAGSVIRMRTIEEISSKNARKGDLVKLEVAEDFMLNDATAIRAGTPAFAELTIAEQKGWMGRSGKLAARMLYLDLPSGPIRLSGKLIDEGQSNEGVAMVVSVFTGFGFITGKSAVLPAGTEVATRLDRSAQLPALAPEVAGQAETPVTAD